MSDSRKDLKNMEPKLEPDNNYWRSFEELYSDPKFLEEKENEFKEGVSDAPDISKMSSLSRRKFLALIGASAALAGTACSDYRDRGDIVPYKNKPEEITLGEPNYYSSTCTGCSSSCGILIKTREGRPIKVDGNPDHPVSKGKVCSQGQASILNLYDPDRLQTPRKQDQAVFSNVSWKDADNEISAALSEVGEKEIAVITNRVTSPTENKLLDDFVKKYPTAKIYSYEQFNESVRNSAWQKSYGTDEFPLIKWNEAKVIVSLDADFLGTGENRIENTRLFAQGRDVMNKKFNRLYAVESNLSLTGMNADYRLRLKPEMQYSFVMSLINELQKKNVINSNVNTSDFSLTKLIDESGLSKNVLKHLLNDLASNKGKAILYAGDHLPEKVHIAVNLLNEALGNTSLYNNEISKYSVRKLSSLSELKTLVDNLKSGKVGIVIHYGTNPVYNFPIDFNYADAVLNADNVITLTEIQNESAKLSSYILPLNHNFEAWGDSKTRNNFYSLQQPVIAPLYSTRQKEAILLTWIKGSSSFYSETVYHEYLMKNWQEDIYPKLNSKLDFKRFWYGALHDGVVISDDKVSFFGSFNNSVLSELNNDIPDSNGITIQIKESYALLDGRFANNGFLQELPHPVSKATWDNYAAVSPATAKKLNLESNDFIEINIKENSLTIPAFIQPGLADDYINIEAGYGRKHSGTVSEKVGFNVNQIFSSTGGLTPWLYTNIAVKKAAGSYKIVLAQTVYDFTEPNKKDLPEKRGIIKEGTVNEYLKNPNFIKEHEEHTAESVNPAIAYNGVKWGMSVDLNKCLGCNECVIACNIENNIPIVGKDSVDKGREMHWLRIDRYYSGTPEDPKVSVQPMLCQHCDQAPCENVCPVAATSHSPDGLNQMVYNRCVGTRYCSNNCPYKVRRFNFFNFRDHFNNAYQESPVFALLENPEVTVRSRGVMEKCTFCIQRIANAKSNAIKNNTDVKGSDVTTACQDACVTNAITFGDINNKNEEFYKYRNHELGYYVLEQLNIKPNVTYLAKLKNIHTEEA